MKIIVDVSSLMWASLLGGKDVENGRTINLDGKDVFVNSGGYGYDGSVSTLAAVLRRTSSKPSDVVLVVEGTRSTAQRTEILESYKGTRKPRAPEILDAFNEGVRMLCDAALSYGATVVKQNGVEADDVIAWLVKNMEGERLILSQDGDLSVLVGGDVCQYRNGGFLQDNPFGPFPTKYITVYKALVGDTSDNLKGAFRFGEKSFFDMLATFGLGVLPALEKLLERDDILELAEDAAEFPPFQRIVDSQDVVRKCYQVAKLRPEWVNVERVPLTIEREPANKVREVRLEGFGNGGVVADEIERLVAPKVKPKVDRANKRFVVFDTEIIGKKSPVFLFCAQYLDTGETVSLWHHKAGDMDKLRDLLASDDLTFVSFNGIHFDAPVIWAALDSRYNVGVVKDVAQAIIVEELRAWDVRDRYGLAEVEFDHIDLMEVAPGVKISLKAYAARMHIENMIDLPFEHDQDLKPEELDVLEEYCLNDLIVTRRLFETLGEEIKLREELSDKHGVDLRSKSDAQIAEAVLKKAAGISGRPSAASFVRYKAPKFIVSDSPKLNKLVERLEATEFKVNHANGAVEAPEWLKEPLQFGHGTYQLGIGGIHSTHDTKMHFCAEDGMLLSDWDVASYYPNIMLNAGIVPNIANGDRFIEAYRDIYMQRMAAKRAGNKKIANSLKITLNGAFGKLGSPYSSFYSPDLMLAVTITGQLNLLCLIHEIEKIGAMCLSANTDGVLIYYGENQRDKVVDVVRANSLRTGFEYEESRLRTAAFANVNNYIAIGSDDVPLIVSPDGSVNEAKPSGAKAKRKGLFASSRREDNPLFLMKNPTGNVVSEMAATWLRDGIHPSESVHTFTDIRDFVYCRAVRGGGIQHDGWEEVDAWELVEDHGSVENVWRCSRTGKTVKRKSPPKPVSVGVGGVPFGRLARWYMSTNSPGPITYVGSGNAVPSTNGAKLCMTLPDRLPPDLDKGAYVKAALEALEDMGVAMA